MAANATSPQVNQVSVSGGGSTNSNASDSTTIIANQLTSLSLNRNALSFGFNGSLVTSSQTVTVNFAGGSGASWTASANQVGIDQELEGGRDLLE